jgi:hypothetical protein
MSVKTLPAKIQRENEWKDIEILSKSFGIISKDITHA